jgi:hypothetical protein
MGKDKDERKALEQDFGLKEPHTSDEPLAPHRKRMLFIACICILGKGRSSCQSSLWCSASQRLTCVLADIQATSFASASHTMGEHHNDGLEGCGTTCAGAPHIRHKPLCRNLIPARRMLHLSHSMGYLQLTEQISRFLMALRPMS